MDSCKEQLGKQDETLMRKLAEAGPSHSKYRRMMIVYADILAPLTWWKQFDTYRIGVEKNSTSTMHSITNRMLSGEDFDRDGMTEQGLNWLNFQIDFLNGSIAHYLDTHDPEKKKAIWTDIINLLPESYLQLRTVMMSYEALAAMYRDRKDHKLGNWHVFCDWIRQLPDHELITLEEEAE